MIFERKIEHGMFQSTLPVKGATSGRLIPRRVEYVSIHAPSEGSDPKPRDAHHTSTGVSIHAPSEGSDETPVLLWSGEMVSIHAPSEGSDSV
mgnify:CR=1 FL=1